jgi:hypothetical protein
MSVQCRLRHNSWFCCDDTYSPWLASARVMVKGGLVLASIRPLEGHASMDLQHVPVRSFERHFFCPENFSSQIKSSNARLRPHKIVQFQIESSFRSL